MEEQMQKMEEEMKSTQALFQNYAFEKKQMRLQVEKLEECLEAADKRNQLDQRFVNTTKAA